MKDQALEQLTAEELRALREYHLGLCAPAQAELIAERCFADDVYFLASESAKEQLIFDYLQQRCLVAERPYFERAFLHHAERRLEVQLLAQLSQLASPLATATDIALDHAAEVNVSARLTPVALTPAPRFGNNWLLRTVLGMRKQTLAAMVGLLCVCALGWWSWQAFRPAAVPAEIAHVKSSPLKSHAAKLRTLSSPTIGTENASTLAYETPIVLLRARATRTITLPLLIAASSPSKTVQASLRRESDPANTISLGNQHFAVPFDANQALVTLTLDLAQTPLSPSTYEISLTQGQFRYSYRFTIECSDC